MCNDTMTLKQKKTLMELLGKDAIVYIDMDGVLAKWETGCTFERTNEPGYFYGLELEPSVKDAILLLLESEFDVRILSAAYEDGTAREDKRRWLSKYGLDHVKYIFTPCGKNKADYVESNACVNHILLDDYNFNLQHWSQSVAKNGKFVAIKFLNGINGGSDSVWTGRTISYTSDGETIAHTLADIAVMA